MLECCRSLEEVRKDGISFDELACLARCNSLNVVPKRPLYRHEYENDTQMKPRVVEQSPPRKVSFLDDSNSTSLHSNNAKHSCPLNMESTFEQEKLHMFHPYDNYLSLDEFRSDVLNSCSRSNGPVLVVSYSRKQFLQTGDGHFSPIGGYHRKEDKVLILDTARFKYPPHWVDLEMLYHSMCRLDLETNLTRGWMLWDVANGIKKDPSSIGKSDKFDEKVNHDTNEKIKNPGAFNSLSDSEISKTFVFSPKYFSFFFLNSKELEVNSYFLASSSTQNRLFSSSAISFTSVTQNAEVLGSQQSADKLDNVLQAPSLHNPDPSLNLAHDITPSVSDIQVAVDVIEPSLRSLGLCHWWPSGFMQSALEAIHINLDLSWGGTIILATILLRMCVFPLVIRSRKLMIKTNHHTPNLQQLQYKMHTAVGKQNKIAALGAMRSYQKEHGLSNFGPIAPLMLSGVCFSTMIFALRGMAELPVESMKEQGMGWFIDLTSNDPFFILPVLTSLTLALNFKLGVDTSNNSMMPPTVIKIKKNAEKIIPFAIFPVLLKIPTALGLYWFTTNIISVIQGSMLRNKEINKLLGVGEFKIWPKEVLPMQGVDPLKELLINKQKKGKRDENNVQKFDLDEVLKLKHRKPLKRGEK